ncbi:MAG: amidohydrolase family protein [Vicinamibacterales bacterium]
MTVLDRRRFIAATLGTLAAPGRVLQAAAQPAATIGRGWIDLHHHFAPPAWVAEVRGKPLLQPANTRWTPEQSIEDMDRIGAAASVLSITNPGLWFGDAAQVRRLARASNEYGARLVQDRPTRFGLFAALPLPDVEASLAEVAYAFDTLKADGIGLFTNYGDRWLGNPAFRPVMEELNRRKAVVAVHPTAADCCRGLAYAPGVGPGTIEYGTDTTRAILGVAFSGDATRFPDIRFIWSHAGGSAPFFAGRIEGAASGAKDALPNGFIAAAKRFYYDTAGASNRGALVSLRELVEPSQIVFGTDYPSAGSGVPLAKALVDTRLFNDAELQAVGRANALRLLPRFA